MGFVEICRSWLRYQEAPNYPGHRCALRSSILWYGDSYTTSRCTEDEKVSLDELQERISEDEDHVQSTDIAAMQSTCKEHSYFGCRTEYLSLRIVECMNRFICCFCRRYVCITKLKDKYSSCTFQPTTCLSVLLGACKHISDVMRVHSCIRC